jgi:hypothetical protein
MRVRVKAAVCVALIGAGATTAAAIGSDGEKVRTGLNGFEEVPAVITDGEGSFKARINHAARTLDFELSYSGLEGGEVRQAHIHAGQETANGGIVVWLCDSATNPAPIDVDVDTCPAQPATVTGTVEAAAIQVVPAQGFRADADRFAKLVSALRAGVAYANVHTATSPGGEIRGQILDRQND